MVVGLESKRGRLQRKRVRYGEEEEHNENEPPCNAQKRDTAPGLPLKTPQSQLESQQAQHALNYKCRILISSR